MDRPRLPAPLDRLLVGLFVAAVTLPLAATVAGIGRADATEENRQLAPWPGLPYDRVRLAVWPDAFTRYYTDHFAFRSTLVRWQARARVQALQSSPTPDVLLGRNGWLFYGTDGAIEDFTASDPFAPEELEHWCATLRHTQDWLERQGRTFLFVVTPDKHLVYPDHMPPGVRRLGRQTRAAQLVRHLREHSTVRALDLTDPLRTAGAAERLYHRTDTHWNDVGAFTAYREIMARLPRPDLAPAPTRADFDLRRAWTPGRDLARMLGLGAVLREDAVWLEPHRPRTARVVEPVQADRDLMYARVVTERPGTWPRAVIFRDSFASALIPHLSEHFSRAVYLWQNDVDPALVMAEQPDVVIQQWVGRHLYTAVPYDAVAVWTGAGQQ